MSTGLTRCSTSLSDQLRNSSAGRFRISFPSRAMIAIRVQTLFDLSFLPRTYLASVACPAMFEPSSNRTIRQQTNLQKKTYRPRGTP